MHFNILATAPELATTFELGNKNSTRYHLWIDPPKSKMCPEAENYIISVEKLYTFIGVMKRQHKHIDKFYHEYRQTERMCMIFGSIFIEVDCSKTVGMGQQVPINKRIGLDLVGPLRITVFPLFFPGLSAFLIRTRRKISFTLAK